MTQIEALNGSDAFPVGWNRASGLEGSEALGQPMGYTLMRTGGNFNVSPVHPRLTDDALRRKTGEDEKGSRFRKSSAVWGPNLEPIGATPNSVGVFDYLDEMKSPDGTLRQHISNFRSRDSLSYTRRLVERLEFLLEAIKEEGEVWQQDSGESLRNMLKYLESVPHFSEPEITVTPEMTFRAEWGKGSKAHFAANFKPDGMVSYVVFSPDPVSADHVQRISGVSAWKNLSEILKPFKVERWAKGYGG